VIAGFLRFGGSPRGMGRGCDTGRARPPQHPARGWTAERGRL